MAGAATDAVWIDVLPSMRGFGPALSQGVGAASTSAGKEAGTTFGKALLAGVAVVGAGAALATKALYEIGSTFNDLRNNIATNTGASGKDLDRMTDAARRIGQTVPRSFEDIGGAVVSVRQSLKGAADMSDAEFDRMTTNALNFSKVFEVDMDRTTQIVGQMMKSGLVKDGTQAFDLLTAAMQKVPVGVREDILDAIDEYGPFMKSMGLDGEAAMNLLVKASEKGMYGIDKTGDAIKEFTIRATDMSTASKVGFDALGMSQKEMSDKLLAGGEVGKKAFNDIITGLRNIKDPALQSQAALALFGTPLEDLNTGEIPQFLEGLQSTSGVLGDTAGAAQRMGDTLNSGPGAQIQLLKNRLMDVLAPAAEKVFGGINNVLGLATQAFSAFTGAFTAGDGDITSSGFNGYMETLGFVARTAFDYLKSAAQTIFPILVGAFQTVGGAIQAVVGFFADHDTAARVLMATVALVGGFIAAAWVAQATVSAINAAKAVAAWFATATASTTSATIQERSTAQIVVGWLAASASAAWNALKIAAAWAVGVAETGVLMAMYAAQSIASAATSAAAWVAAQARTVASLVVTAAGFVAQGAVMLASMAVTAAGVVAGWVLMGVQSLIRAAQMAAAWLIAMGPIAIVIAAVIGLVALIIANWDTVKEWTVKIWTAVWGFIKDVATAIWNWVTTTFNSLRDGVIAIFTTIRDVAMAVWNGLRDAVVAAAKFIWDMVVAYFNAWKTAVTFIFTTLRDAVLAVWNAFRDAVVAAAQWIWDKVVQIFNLYKAAVLLIWTTLRDVVMGIWNGFRDAVIAVATWIWNTVVGAFTNLKNGAVAVFQGIRDVVMGVWNGFRDAIVNGAQTIWQWVVDRFNGLKDGATRIFQGIKDTISNIWNGIIDAVKSPIRIVFNFVNDNMIDPVNSILSKFPGNLSIPHLPRLAEGGLLRGPGTGTSDSILGVDPRSGVPTAAVSNGEYVVKASRVRQVGVDFMDAFNAGQFGRLSGLAKLATGGIVDRYPGIPQRGLGGWISGAWDATGGAVWDQAKNAVSSVKNFATDMLAKGARAAANAVLGPLRDAANSLLPDKVPLSMLKGGINKLFDAVMGKGDEQDREQAALSGGGFSSGKGRTPNGVGGLGPVAAAARQDVMQRFGLSNIGGYSYRTIAGTNTLSDHATGHAIDVMIPNYKSPGGISKGNAVANYFTGEGSRKYPVKYVIWRDQINEGRGWAPYGHPGGGRSDTLQHRDHDHISFYDQGGLWPTGRLGMNLTGGTERVLTPPQDDYFQRFVDVSEQAAQPGSSMPPVHLYTPDIPHALRALRAEEQQREALAPTW